MPVCSSVFKSRKRVKDTRAALLRIQKVISKVVFNGKKGDRIPAGMDAEILVIACAKACVMSRVEGEHGRQAGNH